MVLVASSASVNASDSSLLSAACQQHRPTRSGHDRRTHSASKAQFEAALLDSSWTTRPDTQCIPTMFRSERAHLRHVKRLVGRTVARDSPHALSRGSSPNLGHWCVPLRTERTQRQLFTIKNSGYLSVSDVCYAPQSSIVHLVHVDTWNIPQANFEKNLKQYKISGAFAFPSKFLQEKTSLFA